MRQCSANNEQRVDDPGLVHIDVFAGRSVVAGSAFLRGDFVDDHVAVGAAVINDLLKRRGERATENINADLLVAANVRTNLFDRFAATQERDAAAGKNALESRGTSRVQRVVDAVFLLLIISASE